MQWNNERAEEADCPGGNQEATAKTGVLRGASGIS